MSYAKHTPGPWIADDISVLCHPRARMNVSIATCTPNFSQDGSVYANARLIAAAPDLLEACNFALSILEAVGNGSGDAANACRSAIAKAEGQS